MLPSVTENRLYHDDRRLRRLAETWGTPLYVFDEALIRAKCRQLFAAVTYRPFQVRYALKALTLKRVLQVIREEGLWADASSFNEVRRALRAGFDTSEVYHTGEGATLDAFRQLVEQSVLINCTSLDQIQLLAKAGGTLCSLRINGGAGHGESAKTNTGGPDSKHGIYFDQIVDARKLAAESGIRIVGIHSHVGSGGNDFGEWLRVSESTFELAKAFPDIETINLGGGLPVNYADTPVDAMSVEIWGEKLGERMNRFSNELGRKIALQIEPGRFIVATAGLMLTRVQAVKSTSSTRGQSGRTYAVVDTGFNHNPRPAMYGSYHPMRTVAADERSPGAQASYVVAGNICESGDILTVDRDSGISERCLERIVPGDLVVIAGCGAYTQSMKSEYNSMDTPASVMVRSNDTEVLIERRGTFEDLIAREQ